MKKPLKLKEEFEKLLEILLKELQKHYGERLFSVVVYGSVARGTHRPDSDLDLLIIVENLPKSSYDRFMEFLKIEEKLEPRLRRLRKKGIYTHISPVLKTPEEAKKVSLLYLDMTEDAKIIYDKDNFFRKILEELKEKLKKLGSKRIWRGNAWYWILKPDLKPGEIIEL